VRRKIVTFELFAGHYRLYKVKSFSKILNDFQAHPASSPMGSRGFNPERNAVVASS
jgi:hypothetical protein